MSAEITTQRSIEYTTNLQLLSQQLGSRLRGAVMVGSHRGKQAVPVDQIGTVEAYAIAGRRQNNNYADTPHRRRWVFPQRYAVHDTIDIADQVELLADPSSQYARAQTAAIGRLMDRKILLAGTGTSTTGESAGSTEAFDTTNNKIVHGSAGFTFDKLNQAVRIIREQTKDFVSGIVCAVNARGIEDLLAETKVGSADYNTVRTLVNGEVNTFMGVRFIPTEETSVLTVSTTYSALMWVPSGMHLGVWEDINGRVDVLPEMEHLTQISAYANFGATRLEQAKVVQIEFQ
jgi:hypothetical protein